MCIRSSKSTKINFYTSITRTSIFRRPTRTKRSTRYAIGSRVLSVWPTTCSSCHIPRSARICSQASERAHASTSAGVHDGYDYRSIHVPPTNITSTHPSGSPTARRPSSVIPPSTNFRAKLRFTYTPPREQCGFVIISPCFPSITPSIHQRASALHRRPPFLTTGNQGCSGSYSARRNP